MSAHAPTKTYSRAVSANLEFQRQLGLTQNSLEGKKRHARCDLNTQIITLRETLFNIRARTPTVLNDDYEDRSPNHSSSVHLQNAPGGLVTSPRGSNTKRKASTPASTPLHHGGGRGSTSGGAMQESPTGETLIASQNGLVATSSRTYSSTQGRRSPSRVVHVSVGAQQLRGRSPKKALDVRFVPNAQKKESLMTSDLPPPGSGHSNRSVSVRGGGTPVPSGKGGSVRRVVFSAHPARKRGPPQEGQEGSGDEHTENNGSVSGSVPTSLKSSFSRISERPATAADGTLDKRVNTSQRLMDKRVSNSQKVTFTSIGPSSEGRQAPRPSSRGGTLITPRGMNETVRAAGALVAGNHPSTKGKHNDNQPPPKINYLKDKNPDRRNSNLTNLKSPAGKPKTLFLVRNPFFKLDPCTEKRLEQVESIRLSLQDIYEKRDKKRKKEEAESRNTKSKDSVDGKGSANDVPSPGETVSRSPCSGVTSKPGEVSVSSPRSNNASPPGEGPRTTVTVKVRVPSARRSSRYSVHQVHRGPLTIPGVSGNQLKDLENFHSLMNRKKAVRNSIGS